MIQQEIVSGNRAVVITANDVDGPFCARVWVNVREGLVNADATLVTRKFKTMPRAIKWAQQELALTPRKPKSPFRHWDKSKYDLRWPA